MAPALGAPQTGTIRCSVTWWPRCWSRRCASRPRSPRARASARAFNDQFGNIDWKDGDKIREVIAEEIPAKVAADKAYQNAQKHSDRQNARIEHDKALGRVVTDLLADHTELFKQFSDNPSFKKWLADTIFSSTYNAEL